MTKNWIEWKWTPEKPYPETLDTRVWIKCSDGFVAPKSARVRIFDWRPSDITHYKLA